MEALSPTRIHVASGQSSDAQRLKEEIAQAKERITLLQDEFRRTKETIPPPVDPEADARKMMTSMRYALASKAAWDLYWRGAILAFSIGTVDKEKFVQEFPARLLKSKFQNMGEFRHKFRKIEQQFQETREKEQEMEERIDDLRIQRLYIPDDDEE